MKAQATGSQTGIAEAEKAPGCVEDMPWSENGFEGLHSMAETEPERPRP